MRLKRGRGYVAADKNFDEDLGIGFIPIDSVHSPIKKVNYLVEAARLGQTTDYDKLTLTLETDGTVVDGHLRLKAAQQLGLDERHGAVDQTKGKVKQAVGDVTGHGVAAAADMALIRGMVTALLHSGVPVAELVIRGGQLEATPAKLELEALQRGTDCPVRRTPSGSYGAPMAEASALPRVMLTSVISSSTVTGRLPGSFCANCCSAIIGSSSRALTSQVLTFRRYPLGFQVMKFGGSALALQ